MNRIDRLFGIITLLQAKKYVPVEQLAAQFDISVRTVYRDIKALSEQGIPLSFEPHRGYFLVPGYFLPPASLTPDEANALLLLETIAAQLADQSVRAHSATALHKVKAVLRAPEKQRLEQLAGRLKLHLPEYFGSSGEYLATLQSALAGQHRLELEYGDKSGSISQRQVEPIGLAFYNFAWHLIGWCHLRQAYRDFRVTRIRRLTATTMPFQQPQHITLAEYIVGLNLPHEV